MQSSVSGRVFGLHFSIFTFETLLEDFKLSQWDEVRGYQGSELDEARNNWLAHCGHVVH